MIKFLISIVTLCVLNTNLYAESGRLTNFIGQPIIKSDTGPQSKIYLAPFNGNKKIINGVEREFTSSPLDTTGPFVTLAGRTPGALYDMFTYWNGSAVQLCTAPMQTSSIVAPPPPSGGYVQLTGAQIGGMTAYGGISSAFNNALEGWANSAHSPGVVSGVHIDGTVGMSGLTAPVTRFVAKSPTDNGFLGNNGAGTWQIRGSNSTFSAATLITSGSFVAGNGLTLDLSFANSTIYSSVWFVVVGNTTNGTYLSELAMFKDDIGTPTPPVIVNRGIIYYSGRPVNSETISCLSDNGALQCSQYACSYEGSIKLDDTTATVRCDLSYGEDRACPIWNVNNQKQICLQVGNPSQTPINGRFGYSPPNTYDAGIWIQKQNMPSLKMTILSGLPTQSIEANYNQIFFINSSYGPGLYSFGISIDTNNIPISTGGLSNFDASYDATGQTMNAHAILLPFEGIKILKMVESARNPGGVFTFWRQSDSMMTACFKQ